MEIINEIASGALCHVVDIFYEGLFTLKIYRNFSTLVNVDNIGEILFLPSIAFPLPVFMTPTSA
jgi:hypothetical protein